MRLKNQLMSRITLILLFLSLLTASCESLRQSMKEPVDLIVHNGKVYTVDSTFQIAEAFAVREGKFLETGTSEYILAKYSADRIIDAEGKAIYPGFIDAHCHFYSYGRTKRQLNLVGTKSFDEVIESVVRYAKENPDGWIIGRGWDQNDWYVKEFPVKDTLDKLFPERHIYLSRVDGHAALVNQPVLDLAGIKGDTKVSGGKIIVKDGKPTGVLVDNAADSVKAFFPELTKADKSAALMLAQEDCFAVGLTSVSDAGLDKEIIDLMDALHQRGELKMRIYAMLNPSEENKKHYYANGIYQTDRLTVSSFKVYADGALGSRGAALMEPYSDKPDETGFLVNKPEYFRQMAQELYDAGFQMNTHCIGDSANRLLLNIYCDILKGKNDRRWRIEHSQVVSIDDIPLFGRCSIIPSIQPTHATSDMYWAEERLGRDRIQGAYAWKSLIAQNGYAAFGSDFPVESINPLLGFYAAITRKDAKGYPDGGFRPEEILTREQALKGMTIWAAYAAFEESMKGSIEEGKFADFVILEQDIMTMQDQGIPALKVWQTWTGGEQVFGPAVDDNQED